MNRLLREFRLIPVVLFATMSLLALKVGGLITSGGYTLASPRQAQAADDLRPRPPADGRSWARDVLGFPEVTGSVQKPKVPEPDGKPAGAEAGKPAVADPSQQAEARSIAMENGRTQSPAERAVLERLHERREEIEQRARELDIREGLMSAAERRLEARVIELKDTEARINAATVKKDEAEVARLKSLVIMYENMKPKDAARIFDRLDMRVLLEVASLMNPRRLSDVLAQMTPQAAERLTVELATRSSATEKPPAVSELPKIEGRPGG